MVIYPYKGRDLFEESYEKEHIFNMLARPKHMYECGATGVFEIHNEKLSSELVKTVMKDHVFPLFSERHPADSYIRRGIELFNKNIAAGGYPLHVPPFKNNSTKASLYVSKFTEKWIPRLNHKPDEITTLGFCMESLIEWEKERCHWFIDYLKKMYLFFNSEFAWCDLFDYLAKFEGKDPRQYVFGMTFYGPKMVEKIGKDKLLSAPVYKVEELENGGILLMLGEQPFFPHPKRYRDAVGKHLGLNPPKEKKIVIPKWLKSTKVGRIKYPKVTHFRLIVGAKPEDITIEKTGVSLHNYFMKNIYEKKDMSSPEGASFSQWFNNLKIELEVFCGGSRYKQEFEPYIGIPVGSELNLEFSLEKLDENIMKTAIQNCTELFEKYELNGKPKMYVIGYDGSRWGL